MPELVCKCDSKSGLTFFSKGVPVRKVSRLCFVTPDREISEEEEFFNVCMYGLSYYPEHVLNNMDLEMREEIINLHRDAQKLIKGLKLDIAKTFNNKALSLFKGKTAKALQVERIDSSIDIEVPRVVIIENILKLKGK
jgi:hypothetical protein